MSIKCSRWYVKVDSDALWGRLIKHACTFIIHTCPCVHTCTYTTHTCVHTYRLRTQTDCNAKKTPTGTSDGDAYLNTAEPPTYNHRGAC